MRPGPLVLRRFLLLAGGLSLALLVAETVLRLADPLGISYYRDSNRYFNEAIQIVPAAARPEGHIFRNRPNAAVEFESFHLFTDGLGMRSSVVGGRPVPDVRHCRILFLGDSVTFAWGVEDPASWVRLLEREGRGKEGRPLLCFNAGHALYDTVQQADWLATYGATLRPDAVVLTFVTNDLDPSWHLYEKLLEAGRAAATASFGERLRSTVRERWSDWFRGLHGLALFLENRGRAQALEARKAERIEDQPWYQDHWRRCTAALEEIRARCAAAGIPFVVFDHTLPPVADLRAWCQAHDVPVYDFTFSDDEWAQGIRNSPADAHANARGQVLLAAKARRALAQEGILAAHR